MTQTETPEQKFSYNLANPGLPVPILISSAVLLLNTFGIKHNGAMDPAFSAESTVTGNVQADSRFQTDYFAFKNFLDGLQLDFSSINCHIQGTNIGIHMVFTCR